MGSQSLKTPRSDGVLDVRAKGLRLTLGRRTLIMGVLNVTPDSFSDGGEFLDPQGAIRRAAAIEREGADIIDVGGESTRPGASEVGVDEEIGRIVPVIRRIASRTGIPISVDTRKSEVAAAAIDAGARIVNDVSGLKHDPKMAGVVASAGAAVIIMHMRGSPLDMQRRLSYRDVVRDVISELRRSLDIAKRAGIPKEAIIIDPGIGFAKNTKQNIEIVRRLEEFKVLKRPICIGVSRKSFIGNILGGTDPKRRFAGTIAACAAAVMNGADILRVHDVAEIRDAALIAYEIARSVT